MRRRCGLFLCRWLSVSSVLPERHGRYNVVEYRQRKPCCQNGEEHVSQHSADAGKAVGPALVLKHRSRFELHPVRSGDDAFMAASRLVLDWLLAKEECYGGSPIAEDLGGDAGFPRAWDYCNPGSYAGGFFDGDAWPALACASRKRRGTSRHPQDIEAWVLEYDEPDSQHGDRRWHSTICLERLGQASQDSAEPATTVQNSAEPATTGQDSAEPATTGQTGATANQPGSPEQDSPETALACRVSVESYCRATATLEGAAAPELPETVATPGIVRGLLEMPWMSAMNGSLRLQTVPNRISPQTFASFQQALTDPQRTLPLALFTTGFNGSVPEHAKQLARRAMGNVNVYVLDWTQDSLRQQLQTLFARGTAAGEYACPRGSARLYMPGVDLTDPHHSRGHQSWNRQALDGLRPSQFAQQISRKLMSNQPVKCVQDLQEGTNQTQ